MRRGTNQIWKVAMVWAAVTTSTWAADFVAPAEGPLPFRRDRLPLDSEAMAELSQHLSTLANGMEPETAASRRTAAQLLALSVALDPANADARRLLADFAASVHEVTAEKPAQAASRARVRVILDWLADPLSGEGGKGLAKCLADVLAASDSQDSEDPSRQESGAWAGWIPPVAAYEPAPEPADETLSEPSVPVAAIKLAQASLGAPVWKTLKPATAPEAGRSSVSRWVLKPGMIAMSATLAAPESKNSELPFAIKIPAADPGKLPPRATAPLLSLLESRFPELPPGGVITLGDEEFAASIVAQRRPVLDAGTAVLALAALSGRAPNAAVIGTVDPSGKLGIPADFWNQLQALQAGSGGRLVLPVEAADYLPSILAMEKPEFFMKYEVLLAKSLDEMLELSAKEPTAAIAEIIGRFEEVRGKFNDQEVRTFVANPFVRRRLSEIGQAAPYHVSARMLSIQGAGQRPTKIPRRVLVAEILRAIAPMDLIENKDLLNPETVSAERLLATFEVCRKQLETLKRYAEREDLGLLGRVEDMVLLMRPLERALRTRGATSGQQGSATAAHSALLRTYTAILEELAPNLSHRNGAPESSGGPD
jgi:hypothetical protein